MNILDEQKQELTDVLFTKYFIRFNFLGKRFVCNYDGSSEYWDEIKINGERYEILTNKGISYED